MATRFLGATNEVENTASRLLHCSVLAARFSRELSAKRVRALLSRASIRPRHTEFPRMVSGAIDGFWHRAHRWHDLFHRAVRHLPASTENVVDLGNCSRRRLLVFFGHDRAGIYRAAVQFV